MKLMYKILIFLTVFYGVVFMVNSMGIFPETFYSDAETGITDKSASGIITAIFVPSLNNWGLDSVSATAITAFIVVGAVGSGLLVQSPVLPSVIIVGYLFFNMMTRSYGFLSKLFEGVEGSPTSLVYLGVCIGAALFVIGLITVVEMVAQGGSGGE